MNRDNWMLSVERPGGGTTRYQIRDDVVTLGRSRKNTIVIDDDNVSRNHARFELIDGVWHVYDCGSRNGTLINDRKLAPHFPVVLGSSDHVRISSYIISLHRMHDCDSVYVIIDEDPLSCSDHEIAAELQRIKELIPCQGHHDAYIYVHDGIRYGPLSRACMIRLKAAEWTIGVPQDILSILPRAV